MAERLFTKAAKWKGNDLKGYWTFTLKIDGVRCFRKDGGYVSRADKPLWNIPILREICPKEGYEAYNKVSNVSVENYIATVAAVRAKNKPDRMLTPDSLYRLGPNGDRRLHLGTTKDPSSAYIQAQLEAALANGYEGLVLYGPDGDWLKVKPVETYDVPVIGVIPGKGKNKGRMGALMTPMGKVGSGFSDAEREEDWNLDAIIEVGAMSLTKDGKFRMPRFIRRRFDKTETDA